MGHHMFRIVSKITVAIVVVLATLVSMPAYAHAAEITPDPSTYSHGSTSEFSAYRNLNEGGVTDGSLADTGDPGYYHLIIGGLLLSGAAAFLLVRKQKHLAN